MASATASSYCPGDPQRADGFDVRDEDVARLSPFVRHHVNMLGRYCR
nr:Tn3 family transposase [Streptomyces rectiverticillatus]